jgi:hypothetical protein
MPTLEELRPIRTDLVHDRMGGHQLTPAPSVSSSSKIRCSSPPKPNPAGSQCGVVYSVVRILAESRTNTGYSGSSEAIAVARFLRRFRPAFAIVPSENSWTTRVRFPKLTNVQIAQPWTAKRPRHVNTSESLFSQEASGTAFSSF